jgi:hypothetical protein
MYWIWAEANEYHDLKVLEPELTVLVLTAQSPLPRIKEEEFALFLA